MPHRLTQPRLPAVLALYSGSGYSVADTVRAIAPDTAIVEVGSLVRADFEPIEHRPGGRHEFNANGYCWTCCAYVERVS